MIDNCHGFAAIRGVQAGREYYVAMLPLKIVAKLLQFDEPDLPAELRAQRSLNRARVPVIARYLIENPREYTLSSLTASVDGKVRFEPLGEAPAAKTVGRLLIPMSARFLINDGQHRRAAIESALRERPRGRYFPHASHQIVILSTDTEIDQSYFRELAPYVSHAYHLRYDEQEAR